MKYTIHNYQMGLPQQFKIIFVFENQSRSFTILTDQNQNVI